MSGRGPVWWALLAIFLVAGLYLIQRNWRAYDVPERVASQSIAKGERRSGDVIGPDARTLPPNFDPNLRTPSTGEGWACFAYVNMAKVQASDCERDEALCEAVAKGMRDAGSTTTRCTPQKAAACVRYYVTLEGQWMDYCAGTIHDCREFMMTRLVRAADYSHVGPCRATP